MGACGSKSAAMATSEPDCIDLPNDKVCFMSDVEGNLGYFQSLVERSEALSYADANKTKLVLKDGWHFVYGGDVCDKNNGTLRFLTQIVALKKKDPSRVTFLVGNRDCNKMRFTAELDDAALEHPVKGPLTETKVDSKTKLIEKMSAIEPDTDPEELYKKFNTKENRLKWILDETMGAIGEFDFRQDELAIMKGCDKKDISSSEVVDSYLKSVQPGGVIYEYLHSGVLAKIIGRSLYCHGGVIGQFDGDCIGRIPGRSDTIGSVKEWVKQLNQWYRSQLDEWKSQPKWKDPANPTERGGNALLKYTAAPSFGHTVVMARHLDAATSRPVVMPGDTVKKLTDANLCMLVVGHTPHGNSPTLIQQDGFLVVMTDTSYSDFSAADKRGVAHSCVTISDNGQRVDVDGILEDNRAISYGASGVDAKFNDAGIDKYIGRPLTDKDGFWVKAKLSEGDQYVICRVDGFKYTYETVGSDDLNT
eukprot:GFYU01011287.1.p1 GENE.GFYU01011287.1~~GFYU01011287.1.p1  ORF type:complete len:476 (-),score=136.32 GFYU01011287.1:121-1548(-)